ncbi:hypothetical protein [Luteimonas sp. R10]|uniref:hypothetical protein n=1 Tax=Luteimonas sp. R10 TaxID=3108176 RepID=UPI0030933987|nr:hypothetical protein U3649_01025 [Luteimonas sp. R10]
MLLALWALPLVPRAAPAAAQERWIRPADVHAPPVWGIRGGIVFSLWPDDLETGWPRTRPRPRGLIRIGREQAGMVYLINFVAVEPVVDGKMEFSEISPSRVDGQWGKLMWAGDAPEPGAYAPHAITRGTVTHPDPSDPAVEELSLYVFMEPFANGAHPYLRLSIRSDRPDEIGFQVFDHDGSAPMQRCTLTATMGNYARARLLHLRDGVIDARELYAGFDGIGFVEKDPYPADAMQRTPDGDLIAAIAGDEPFEALASWPQTAPYRQRWGWRWRPFFKVAQYWRKPAGDADASLQVRVNGRAKYWATGSRDPADYVDIPGGVAFENFELRQDYRPGQTFHFGITRKTPEELIAP